MEDDIRISTLRIFLKMFSIFCFLNKKIHTTKTDTGECDKFETSTVTLVKFAIILAKAFSKKKKKENKENQAKLYKNKKLDKGRKL